MGAEFIFTQSVICNLLDVIEKDTKQIPNGFTILVREYGVNIMKSWEHKYRLVKCGVVFYFPTLEKANYFANIGNEKLPPIGGLLLMPNEKAIVGEIADNSLDSVA